MPGHDYSNAEKFGSLVFIGREDLNSRFGLLATPGNREVLRKMALALDHFEAGDYLLLDGNPVLFAAAVNYLTTERNQDVNILKWDNREYDYQTILYQNLFYVDMRDLKNDRQHELPNT